MELTTPYEYIVDEFGFLKYNGTVYASAAPALSKAREAAIKNKTPYGIIITTTPNDKDSNEGAYAYSILSNAALFDITWYDKTGAQIRDIIKNSSKNNFVYIKCTYQELGRDDEWFKEQCRNMNNDLMKIKRELLLEWTEANDRSPFSEEQLSTIKHYVKEKPISFMYIKNYQFLIYEELDNIFRTNWIISMDIGGGLGLDNTVISIIHPRTKKLQAIFKSSSITGPELVSLTKEMLSTFFPNAVIVPERNSLGLTVIQTMMLDPVIRPRLYYEVKEKIAEKKVLDVRSNRMIKKKDKVQVYGQTTDKKTRETMFNEILAYMVDQEPDAIICKDLYEDLKNLERSNKGKVAAKSGAHDDIVMSWLIGLHALMYGKNINKFITFTNEYTINKDDNGNIILNNETKSQRYVKNITKIRNIHTLPNEINELITQSQNMQSYNEPEQNNNNIKIRVARLLGK